MKRNFSATNLLFLHENRMAQIRNCRYSYKRYNRERSFRIMSIIQLLCVGISVLLGTHLRKWMLKRQTVQKTVQNVTWMFQCFFVAGFNLCWRICNSSMLQQVKYFALDSCTQCSKCLYFLLTRNLVCVLNCTGHVDVCSYVQL